MFVICLMGKDKVFQADEAAIVNRLSTETKWDLGITSLNVSCAEHCRYTSKNTCLHYFFLTIFECIELVDLLYYFS